MIISGGAAAGWDRNPGALEVMPMRFPSGSAVFSQTATWMYSVCDLVTSTTATTQQELVNIAGEGLLHFAGVWANADATLSATKYRIDIDGETLIDTTCNPGGQQGYSAVGACAGGSSLTPYLWAPANIYFKSSCSIWASGDGVERADLFYSRTLF